MKLRILIADDHTMVREGLKAILNAQPDMIVVSEVEDGAAAIHDANALQPDVALIDLSMPHVNGLAVTEALRESGSGVKVVVLTRHHQTGYVQRLFSAGASAYVLKQSRTNELLRAIRAVAAGAKYLDSHIDYAVVEDVRRGEPLQAADLSVREEEVLRIVASGYSNKEIAAQVLRSVKTIETHKFNGMRKLRLKNRIDVVQFARLRGWLADA
jgi:DNA-binding NarL/FixJ family response regulator